METPFLFGKTVSEEAFTNRTADIARLMYNPVMLTTNPAIVTTLI